MKLARHFTVFIMKLLGSKRERKIAAEFRSYKLGITKDKADARDYKFSEKVASSVTLPAIVDYSQYATIKNQGEIGSCGSMTATTGVEVLDRIESPKWYVPLSEINHYYNVRQADYMNTFSEDSGQTGREAMRVLANIGICPDVLQPYDTSKFNNAPNIFARSMTRFWKIKTYYRCYTIDDIKGALATHKLVWLGVPVQSDIFAYRSSATNPRIYNWISGSAVIGGHAMLIVGYDDTKKAIKICNSWGSSWGDGGFGYISYDYINQCPWIDLWAFDMDRPNPKSIS